jgi:hypothetical protein
MNPFDDSRGRQSDSSSELRKRNARVRLKLGQNFAVDVVDRWMYQASQ